MRKENGGEERGAAGLGLVDQGAVAAGAERAPREDTGGADAMGSAGVASSESESTAGLEKTLRLGGVWPEGDSSTEFRDRLELGWGVDVVGTWDEVWGWGNPQLEADHAELADVKVALAASDHRGWIVVADEVPQGEVLFAEVAD